MADSFKLFGFEIKKSGTKELESFVPPNAEDGAYVTTASGTHYAYSLDIDQSSLKNEKELIESYRMLSMNGEIDQAIDEVVNEAIVYEEDDQSVKLDFTDEFSDKYSEKTKQIIISEFDNVLKLLDFNSEGSELFRRWYVDGRIALHKIIDNDKTKEGIKEIRFVDPIKLKKVVEIKKEKNPQGVEIIKGKDEYFVYNDKGFTGNEKQGIKIAKDSITWVTSGLLDYNTNAVLSYLHNALRPANQLRMVEDSSVIYRLARAPEKRVFYIDTGDMGRTKGEEYMKQVMARYSNKQVYDAKTGSVKDNKHHLSIMEDFWLPRSNGKGTEITTLPGAANLGQIEDIEYFRQKLYQSLKVPLGRLLPQQSVSIGKSNEITRDEVKFSKFIDRMRKRFNQVFMDILRTQLILKGIATVDDWEEIKEHLMVNYNRDNYFAELKDAEIFAGRIDTIRNLEGLIGKFFSKRYVMKDILKMTDEDIIRMAKEIEEETPEVDPENPDLTPEGPIAGADEKAQDSQTTQDSKPTK
ncbi:portal (connector) protein [Synechococcus phage BUCT-ZZ01]|nr:portal (connector) protein [Synechococcus phage BUCT-ZZ01]